MKPVPKHILLITIGLISSGCGGNSDATTPTGVSSSAPGIRQEAQVAPASNELPEPETGPGGRPFIEGIPQNEASNQ